MYVADKWALKSIYEFILIYLEYFKYDGMKCCGKQSIYQYKEHTMCVANKFYIEKLSIYNE